VGRTLGLSALQSSASSSRAVLLVTIARSFCNKCLLSSNGLTRVEVAERGEMSVSVESAVHSEVGLEGAVDIGGCAVTE
jgi:hypothetical protein